MAGERVRGLAANEQPLHPPREHRYDLKLRLLLFRAVKTLLVLRHGKSSWSDGGLADHDRPLKKRGRKDAPKMGRALLDHGLVPDLILSSTARRARETALLVAEASGHRGAVQLEAELYEADPAKVLEVVRRSAGGAGDRIMLVGHNPAFEALVEILTRKSVELPTCALAWLELSIASWLAIDGGVKAKLRQVWTPKNMAHTGHP
jgi:phosphohistidine phosphatase